MSDIILLLDLDNKLHRLSPAASRQRGEEASRIYHLLFNGDNIYDRWYDGWEGKKKKKVLWFKL